MILSQNYLYLQFRRAAEEEAVVGRILEAVASPTGATHIETDRGPADFDFLPFSDFKAIIGDKEDARFDFSSVEAIADHLFAVPKPAPAPAPKKYYSRPPGPTPGH